MSRSSIRLGQDLINLSLRHALEQASQKSEAKSSKARVLKRLSGAAVVGLSGGVLSVEVPRKALEKSGFLASLLAGFLPSDQPFCVEIGAMRIVGEVGSRALVGQVTHRTETMVPRLIIAPLILLAKPSWRSLLRGLLERSTFHVPLREILAGVGDGSLVAALDSQDISVFEVDGDQILIEIAAVYSEDLVASQS